MPYYGTNGFYLPFKNNASTTTLGWDYSSGARYNAAANGNAQISTAQSKFGGSSLFLDGTGDYLQFSGESDFAFGTGDFTIEFWFRTNNVMTSTSTTTIFDGRPVGTNGLYPLIWISTDNKVQYYVNGVTVILGSTVLATNTWYHVAVSRSGTSTRLFINGTQEGVTYSDSNNYIIGANRPVIGTNSTTTAGFVTGYIDDLRVYKGAGKYTANFTAPTGALAIGPTDPYWQYCVLAMPMDGTNASTTFPVYRPNNWTPNNFSVTAGAGNDSMIDVPTPYADGSNNRGNYCTLNSVANLLNDNSALGSIKNGNLTLDYTGTPGTNSYSAIGTFVIKGGKWYWEGTLSATGTSSRDQIGLMLNTNNFTNGNLSHLFLDTSGAGNYGYTGAGSTTSKASSPATYSSYGAAFTVNDIIGVAFDSDAGSITFYKNGVSQGVAFTGLTDSRGYYPAFGRSSDWEVNFGQRPFSYTPPSGFKALNTFNLP